MQPINRHGIAGTCNATNTSLPFGSSAVLFNGRYMRMRLGKMNNCVGNMLP
jgi:hypothetical protein